MTPEEQLLRIASLQRRFINFDTDIKRLWKRASLSPQGYVGTPAAAEAPVVPVFGGEFCSNCDAASSYIRLTFDVEIDGGATDPNDYFGHWNNGVFNLPLFSNSPGATSVCSFRLELPFKDDPPRFINTVRFLYTGISSTGKEQVTTHLSVGGISGETWDYVDSPLPDLGTWCSLLGDGTTTKSPQTSVQGNVTWGDVLIERIEGTAPAHPS